MSGSTRLYQVETLEMIRRHMDWWRKEARDLATSHRAADIRAGSLITRLLNAIEKEASK